MRTRMRTRKAAYRTVRRWASTGLYSPQVLAPLPGGRRNRGNRRCRRQHKLERAADGQPVLALQARKHCSLLYVAPRLPWPSPHVAEQSHGERSGMRP